MEKISSIIRKDALFAIPYDIVKFRLTTKKLEEGKELSDTIRDEELIRLSTAWDYPRLCAEDIIEILTNDRADFPLEMINTVQSRAVGMLSATYVIPFTGEKKYTELAKKHIERIESDMLMTHTAMARWWSKRKA
jgi:hypothetical protein